MGMIPAYCFLYGTFVKTFPIETSIPFTILLTITGSVFTIPIFLLVDLFFAKINPIMVYQPFQWGFRLLPVTQSEKYELWKTSINRFIKIAFGDIEVVSEEDIQKYYDEHHRNK
jgi:hypothetical protein